MGEKTLATAGEMHIIWREYSSSRDHDMYEFHFLHILLSKDFSLGGCLETEM